MKEVGKKIGMYVILFVGLIGIYWGGLTIACCIPSKALQTNVKHSAKLLEKLGEKQTFHYGMKKNILFLFTDALMINTAYSIDSTKPVESFLLARKNYIPGKTEILNPEPLENLKSDPKYAGTFQTKELYDLVVRRRNVRII